MIYVRLDESAVHSAHTRALTKHNSAVEGAILKSQHYGIDHVRTMSRFKRRSATGSLKDTTKSKVTRTRNEIRVWFYSNKNYAEYIQWGTKAHEIRASRAKNLHFFWEKKGIWFTGPKVQHPGTKPYHFLTEATDNASHVFGLEYGRKMTGFRF